MKHVQTHFHKEAGRYDVLVRHLPGYDEMMKRIIFKTNVNPGDRVLDIGAGTGSLPLKLAMKMNWRGEVVGIDISKEMLKIASQKLKGTRNIALIVADARKIPLIGGAVDAIVSSYTFHHLTDEEKLSAAKECSRVLREQGQTIIGDYMLHERMERYDLVTSPMLFLKKILRGIILMLEGDLLEEEYPTTVGKWIEIFAKARCRTVAVERVLAFTDAIIESRKS